MKTDIGWLRIKGKSCSMAGTLLADLSERAYSCFSLPVYIDNMDKDCRRL